VDWSYESGLAPVPPDVGELHATTWEGLGGPGDWWNGTERVDVIREVRLARGCTLCAARRESISPMSVSGQHDSETRLDAAVVETVHRLTTDANRVTASWAGDRIAALDAAPYAELVGLVAMCNIIDTFCVAVGVAEPEPPLAKAGEPTRVVPEGLDDLETAYVPQRHDPSLPNVRRSLAIVPHTFAEYFSLAGPMYSGAAFGNLVWTHRALNRPQVELLAARTSALNECFY